MSVRRDQRTGSADSTAVPLRPLHSQPMSDAAGVAAAAVAEAHSAQPLLHVVTGDAASAAVAPAQVVVDAEQPATLCWPLPPPRQRDRDADGAGAGAGGAAKARCSCACPARCGGGRVHDACSVRWCQTWPCAALALVLGVLLALYVYAAALLTATTGSLALATLSGLCGTHWTAVATLQLCNPSPFTAAVTHARACACVDAHVLAAYNSSNVLYNTTSGAGTFVLPPNATAVDTHSLCPDTAAIAVLCVSAGDGDGRSPVLTLPRGGCATLNTTAIDIAVQEAALQQYLNLAMLQSLDSFTLMVGSADVTAYVPFAVSTSVSASQTLAQLNAGDSDGSEGSNTGDGGGGDGGGGGGSSVASGLAIGTISVNDTATELSWTTTLLFNLSAQLAVQLPTVDLALYYHARPFVRLVTPGVQLLQNNASAGPTPTTPSGLPLTPCVACASVSVLAAVQNTTDRDSFLALLNDAYYRRLSAQSFDVRYGSAGARDCLLNRLIVGINTPNALNRTSGSVAPSRTFDGVRYVLRDVTWLSSSLTGATVMLGVEIGPRVFFVAGAIPALNAYASLLPSNASLPPVPVCTLSLPAMLLQWQQNRYQFQLTLSAAPADVFAAVVLAPLLTGRTDGVPAGYIDPLTGDMRLGLVIGSDADVAASGSLLYSIIHAFSESSALFVQTWNTTAFAADPTSYALSLNTLNFLLTIASNFNSDADTITASRSILLPGSTLYDVGTPQLSIPTINVALSTMAAGFGNVQVGSFSFSYSPVFPISTKLAVALTFGVEQSVRRRQLRQLPRAGFPDPAVVYRRELTRVLSAVLWRQPVIDYLYLTFVVDRYTFRIPYSLVFGPGDGSAPFAALTPPGTLSLPSTSCPGGLQSVQSSVSVAFNNWLPLDVAVLNQSLPIALAAGGGAAIRVPAATAQRTSAWFALQYSAPPGGFFVHSGEQTTMFAPDAVLWNATDAEEWPYPPPTPDALPLSVCAFTDALCAAGATGTVCARPALTPAVELPLDPALAPAPVVWQMQALDFVAWITVPAAAGER